MDAASLDRSFGGLTAKTQWHLKTALSERIRARGLEVTPEQFPILMFVGRQPGVSQTEIARKAMKDKTNVTRMLDVLSRKGILIRRADPEDRRAFQVFLTAGGEKVLRQLIAIGASMQQDARDGIREEDLAAFERVCEQVWSNLEKRTGEANRRRSR